jgi:hypothetical protein
MSTQFFHSREDGNKIQSCVSAQSSSRSPALSPTRRGIWRRAVQSMCVRRWADSDTPPNDAREINRSARRAPSFGINHTSPFRNLSPDSRGRLSQGLKFPNCPITQITKSRRSLGISCWLPHPLVHPIVHSFVPQLGILRLQHPVAFVGEVEHL